MRRKTFIFVASLLCAAVGFYLANRGARQPIATTGDVASRTGLPATLPLEEARAIALKAQPGEIISQKFDRVPGGSGARFSFEIGRGERRFSVAVDANTGQTLQDIARD